MGSKRRPITEWSTEEFWWYAGLAAAGLAAIIALFVSNGWVPLEKWARPCLLRTILGWYCPGCGNSRSVRALLSGQIWLSLRYNVFPVLAVIVFALWAAEQALRLFGRPHRLLPRSPRVIVPVGVLLGVYYVIRNIWEFMPV